MILPPGVLGFLSPFTKNLLGLGSAPAVRTALGLGTAATQASTAFAATVETVNTVATSSTAQTIPDPASAATISRITLTANCTLTFPTAAAGKTFSVFLVQDGTGSRTVTWPATVKWPAGTAPTLTTTASKRDAFSFICTDGTNWDGFTAGLNFA